MGILTERIPLQEVLDSIKAVCDANSVMYNLEAIIGQDDGARIRIAYVRPDQKLTYILAVTAGTHVGREDMLEEECLFEVDWDGDKWAHKFTSTMESKSQVLVGLKGELEGACTGKNWDDAHKNIKGSHNDREMAKMWNQGYDRNDISLELDMEPESVTSKIWKLRKVNPGCLLTDKERKSLGRKP